jgi:hypothetical protein
MTPAAARRLAELHAALAEAYREAAGDAPPAPTTPPARRPRRTRTAEYRPTHEITPDDVRRYRAETRRRGIPT